MNALLNGAVERDRLHHPERIEEERVSKQPPRARSEAAEVGTHDEIASRPGMDEQRRRLRSKLGLRNCDRRAANIRSVDHVYGYVMQRQVMDTGADDQVERVGEREATAAAGVGERRQRDRIRREAAVRSKGRCRNVQKTGG